MTEAHCKNQWTHTCEYIAALFNTVRDEKKRRRPYTGQELNPYTVQVKQKPSHTISVTEWRDMTLGKNNGSKRRGN